MSSGLLGRAPEDILLIIVVNLDTARDVSNLASSCRRLHQFMRADGWRAFTRKRFPSFHLDPVSNVGWDKIAESMTWQSRVWDQRALTFQVMLPRPKHPQQHQLRGSQLFHAVVDAHLSTGTREELVAWGAGEDLVARTRKRNGNPRRSHEVSWRQAPGRYRGYRPGYDDVTALKIVENPHGSQGQMGLLVGRASGNLSLVSAEESRFGEVVTTLSPAIGPGASYAAVRKQQDKIYSFDLSTQSNTVAVAAPSHVLFYPMPQTHVAEVMPSATFDLSKILSNYETRSQYRAKWMANESTLVLGFGTVKDPLRYLEVTPYGLELGSAAKSAHMEERFRLTSRGLCMSSIQPLSKHATPGGGGSLLLSAWLDGTCRLQDIRTPSPWDLVYHDNIAPWATFEALLPFGGERFVGAGMEGGIIKVFDFRWPKTYFHTSSLPCSGRTPFPSPEQPFAPKPRPPILRQPRCDHSLGLACTWHEQSRDIYYRPNCNFYFSRSLPAIVRNSGAWTMAKSADISPNFYIGITGGVIEAALQDHPGNGDPNFGFHAGHRDSRGHYVAIDLETSIMETGDGLAYPDNDRTVRLPTMRHRRRGQNARPNYGISVPPSLRRRHRLDQGYQEVNEFLPIDANDLAN